MFAPKNILVPTDFSKYSDAALKKAIDMAGRHDAKIYLLHVVDKGLQDCAIDYCLDFKIVEAIKKNSLIEAKAKLQKEVAEIAKKKKVKIAFDIKRGFPAETILSEQKKKKIDMIVIASHGKTGLLKQMIGSVADKVVKGAGCPVLVVKR
ncbi:MAG TPA: universal stress protein [Syntrophales bacterium]|nr:universal stress protein [Syntrophales bacterium]